MQFGLDAVLHYSARLDDLASISWTAVSVLSRRDSRTQPGVLTPGTYKKNAPPEGAVEAVH